MVMLKSIKIKKTKWLVLLILFLIYVINPLAYAQSKPAEIKLRLAAAANLMGVLEVLTNQYASIHPHVKIENIFGSSGNLSAQILNGAPYQLFLSADSTFPDKIFAQGLGMKEPVIYASGLLCLASRYKLDETAGLQNLTDSRFKTIAIAKPQLAPYGRAALQSLHQAGLDALLPKVIWAENISQAFQYVKTGAADAGFVALTAVLKPDMNVSAQDNTNPLYWIKVDTSLYERIAQSLVIIKSPENEALYSEVSDFVQFILGTGGRKILASAGYGLP